MLLLPLAAVTRKKSPLWEHEVVPGECGLQDISTGWLRWRFSFDGCSSLNLRADGGLDAKAAAALVAELEAGTGPITRVRLPTGAAGETLVALADAVLSSPGVETLNHVPIKRIRESDPTLTKLALRSLPLGDVGMHALGAALRSNRHLLELDLSRTEMSDAGLALLARALESHGQLRSLTLQHNRFGDAGAAALFRSLGAAGGWGGVVEALDVSGANFGREGALALAEVLRSARPRALTTLRMEETSVEGEAAVSLAEAAVASRLASLSGVPILRVAANESGLAALDLTHSKMGDAGAAALAIAMGSNSAVTALQLHNCAIGDAGVERLCAALGALPSLGALSLSMNHFSDRGVRAVARLVGEAPALETLDLAWNDVRGGGVGALLDAVEAGGTLRSLNLASTPVDDGAGLRVASLLRSSARLRELNLFNTRLGKRGAAALAGALLLNRNLTSLSCASSELPHATTAALERAARCNRDGDFGRACKRELEELVEADAAESEAESRTPERHELGTSAARRDEL